MAFFHVHPRDTPDEALAALEIDRSAIERNEQIRVYLRPSRFETYGFAEGEKELNFERCRSWLTFQAFGRSPDGKLLAFSQTAPKIFVYHKPVLLLFQKSESALQSALEQILPEIETLNLFVSTVPTDGDLAAHT